MKLNTLENMAMNNPVRGFFQERHEMQIFRRSAPARQFSTVLDIGCGNGAGSRLIQKYFRPEKIIAVDLDENMIARARRRIDDPNIDFRVMDAAHLEFPGNSFDAVFNFGIIHHIARWRDCIDHVQRVLRPGGTFFVEELALETFAGFPGVLWKVLSAHPYESMFSFDELIGYLKTSGFDIQSVHHSNPLRAIHRIFLNAELVKTEGPGAS